MSHIITSVTELEALYGEVNRGSLLKETDRVVPEYRAFIEAAPFAALATRGLQADDFAEIGDIIAAALQDDFEARKGELADRVTAIAERYPLYEHLSSKAPATA